MAIISYNDLPSLRKKHLGKKIVFCSGSFDLPHLGHIRFFEGCKKLGDILVVAIGLDSQINKVKGENRPILNEQIRLQTIDAVRHVDYVFFNPLTKSIEPLAPIREMLVAAGPDIWAVNHDANQMEFRKKLAEELGIALQVLDLRRDDPEWTELSTTQIIKKIRGLG